MTKVLMSAENPTGWKLEELASAMIDDLQLKIDRLAIDTSMTSVEIRRLNRASISSLQSIVFNQTMVMQELAKIGPDQGPTGTPRIG